MPLNIELEEITAIVTALLNSHATSTAPSQGQMLSTQNCCCCCEEKGKNKKKSSSTSTPDSPSFVQNLLPGLISGSGIFGSVGGIIVSTIVSILETMVRQTISNIQQMAQLGQSSMENLTNGALAITQRAFDVGLEIGDTLLRAVLQPFGASGTAIANVAHEVGQTMARVLQGGLSLAARGANALGGIAGGVGGVLMAGLGLQLTSSLIGIFGILPIFLGPWLGAMFGRILGQIANVVTNVIGEVFQHLGEALGELGRIGGVALQGLITIIGDALHTAQEMGQAVLRLHAYGYSMNQAGNMVQTLGFFGISPNQVAGQFGRPFAPFTTGMRAAVLGLPDPTRDLDGFLLTGARRQEAAANAGPFQAGFFQSQLAAAGFSDYAPVFAQGTNRIQQTLGIAHNFQISGVNLGALGGDVTMATNILQAFGNQLRLVFAETLLPLLPEISRGFAFIVQHRDQIVGAIRSAGQWLVGVLPVIILQATANILGIVADAMDILGTFLTTTFQTWATQFVNYLPVIGGFVDAAIQGLGHLGLAIVNMVDSVINTLNTILSNTWVQRILAPLGLGGQLIPTIRGSQANQGWLAGLAQMIGPNPTGNLFATSGPWGSYITGTIMPRANQAGQGLHNNSRTVRGWQQSIQDRADTWTQYIAQQQQLIDASQQTAQNTGALVNAAQGIDNDLPRLIQNIAARTSALIAEDETLNILRSG